jgi:uncharacterized membrane protein YfcA
VTMALLALAGVGIGVLSALFGVGGGIVIVPLLVLAFGEAQHVSEGTSLLVTMPAAIAGALAHHKRGYVSLRHSRLLALGGVAGAVIGALVALSLPGGALQRVFGVVLLLVGAQTIRRGRARATAPRT